MQWVSFKVFNSRIKYGTSREAQFTIRGSSLVEFGILNRLLEKTLFGRCD
jgi:hypothetical protein